MILETRKVSREVRKLDWAAKDFCHLQRGWLLRTCALVSCGTLAAGFFFPVQAGAVQAAPAPASDSAPNSELRRGREMLQKKQFAEAKPLFSAYIKTHPADVQGELGLGDAQLGLRQYEAAEMSYRAVIAQQPELWQAHKNLVVVEAALRRWEEFNGERTVLRLARERGAPGISPRESDVIDSFTEGGGRWVVRAYFEPVGRSQTLYNFERFSPEGRLQEYVSLENAAAAQAALTPGDVRIGGEGSKLSDAASTYALNWYSGRAHGSIATFDALPSYERVRADLFRWLRGRVSRPQ